MRIFLVSALLLVSVGADCAAPEASGEGDFRSAGSGNAGGGGCSGPPPPGAADDGWVYPGVPMEDLDAEVAAQKKKVPVPPSPQRAGHGLDDDADAADLGSTERDARDAQFKAWEAQVQDQASDEDLNAEERMEKIKHWAMCGVAGVVLAYVLSAMKSSGRGPEPASDDGAAAAAATTTKKQGTSAAKATSKPKPKPTKSESAAAPAAKTKTTKKKKTASAKAAAGKGKGKGAGATKVDAASKEASPTKSVKKKKKRRTRKED